MLGWVLSMSNKPLHPILGTWVCSIREMIATPPVASEGNVLALGSQIRDTPAFSFAEKTLGHLVSPYKRGRQQAP